MLLHVRRTDRHLAARELIVEVLAVLVCRHLRREVASAAAVVALPARIDVAHAAVQVLQDANAYVLIDDVEECANFGRALPEAGLELFRVRILSERAQLILAAQIVQMVNCQFQNVCLFQFRNIFTFLYAKQKKIFFDEYCEIQKNNIFR